MSDAQVLVIDDEPEIRRLIAALLQRIGIQPVLVDGGENALSLFNEGLIPSLVILDLMMPEMDGFEVLARIRKISSLDSVPVLILSAKADPETIRRGLDSGADAYVTKSYMAHSLIDRVRVLMAAGRQPKPRTSPFRQTSPFMPPPDSSDETPSS